MSKNFLRLTVLVVILAVGAPALAAEVTYKDGIPYVAHKEFRNGQEIIVMTPLKSILEVEMANNDLAVSPVPGAPPKSGAPRVVKPEHQDYLVPASPTELSSSVLASPAQLSCTEPGSAAPAHLPSSEPMPPAAAHLPSGST